ncbi:hypothetical protein GCM10029964_006570 [Kibdelosporangium lantanae]
MRRSIVLVSAAAALVAGCSTGQGDPTVAATVGGVRVSTVDQVQQRLNDLLARNKQVQDLAAQHKLDQVARAIVTHDVVHQLITEAAKRQNITTDEGLVAQLAPILNNPDQQQGQDPVQAAVESSYPVTDVTRDKLLLAELVQKNVGRVSSVIDVAFISKADDARALAQQVAAAPDKADALFNATAQNGTAAPNHEPQINSSWGGPVDSQTGQPTDTNGYLQAAGLPFTWLPAKSVLVWLQNGQDGTYYAVVYTKQKATAAKQPDVDTSSVTPGQLAQVGRVTLVGVAQELGVQLNQRYGLWDPIDLNVVPGDQAAASNQLILPTTTAKQ